VAALQPDEPHVLRHGVAVRVTARDQWGKTVTDDFNIS
jgi:hypothetical protein